MMQPDMVREDALVAAGIVVAGRRRYLGVSRNRSSERLVAALALGKLNGL